MALKIKVIFFHVCDPLSVAICRAKRDRDAYSMALQNLGTLNLTWVILCVTNLT